MAMKPCAVLLIPMALLLLVGGSSLLAAAQLEVGYYSKTCPNVSILSARKWRRSSPPRQASPAHSSGCISTTALLGVATSWPVALGRRDGRVSSAAEAANELPPATGDVPLLTKIFASKGLDVKDLVVLSGAHTLGTAHCKSYADRLYNFSGTADPSLDSEYARRLRMKCRSVEDATISEMDPGSYRTFDTSYYRHVAKRRGLFQSDATLLTDATTRAYVRRIASGKFDDEFFRDFSESLIKMGNVGVLTGAQGEIRKKCYIVN